MAVTQQISVGSQPFKLLLESRFGKLEFYKALREIAMDEVHEKMMRRMGFEPLPDSFKSLRWFRKNKDSAIHVHVFFPSHGSTVNIVTTEGMHQPPENKDDDVAVSLIRGSASVLENILLTLIR